MKKGWNKRIILCILAFILCVQPVLAITLDDTKPVEAQLSKEMLKALRQKRVELVAGRTVAASIIKDVQTLQFNIKGTSYKWNSSNKKVAVVSKKGVVRPLQKGTTKITAKKGGKTYACKLTIEEPQLNKTRIRIPVGTVTSIRLTGTNKVVRYSSSNPDVVYVYSNGYIRARKNGIAYVYATVGTMKTYTCKVTVAPDPTPIPTVTPTPVPGTIIIVEPEVIPTQDKYTYALNWRTKKVHMYGCRDIPDILGSNWQYVQWTLDYIIMQRGFSYCGHCHPERYR